MDDMVEHPPHYNRGGIEAMDVARAFAVTPEAFADHCRLTALKYILRAPFKGRYAEDLRKAEWYLKEARGDAHE